MPAGTPDSVVQMLVAETGKLAREPSMAEKAARVGYEWIGAGPDALRRKMAQTAVQAQEVIRAYGITAQ